MNNKVINKLTEYVVMIEQEASMHFYHNASMVQITATGYREALQDAGIITKEENKLWRNRIRLGKMDINVIGEELAEY